MNRLRIAVLDASHGNENTKRNFRRELDASLAEFDVTSGTLPETFEYDAVVVTGSRSSVYWDEPWIERTKAWVAQAIDRSIPFLGICWGHQLLADVLGGTVSDMGVYEVGYSDIEHFENSRLFDGIDRHFRSFTSHADAVVELPPGSRAIAENDYSIHGFVTDRIFGIQFHPEYDVKTARELVQEKELSDERRATVLEGITPEEYDRACQSKLVFENFLTYVTGVDTTAADAADEETSTAATDDHSQSDTRDVTV